jgi:hypothetical protein
MMADKLRVLYADDPFVYPDISTLFFEREKRSGSVIRNHAHLRHHHRYAHPPGEPHGVPRVVWQEVRLRIPAAVPYMLLKFPASARALLCALDLLTESLLLKMLFHNLCFLVLPFIAVIELRLVVALLNCRGRSWFCQYEYS